MVKVHFGDILVEGYDQTSTQEEATAVADVLSKNWLAGVSEDDVLSISISRPNGDTVIYTAKRGWLNA